MNKEIDLSKWIVLRRIDSTTEHRYTIPDGVRVQQGQELRIYSKSGIDAIESSSDYRVASSRSNPKLINRELASWGMLSHIYILSVRE
jgi:hypothetical protein